MDKEMKETVLKIADYSNDENRRFTRRLCCLFVIGFAYGMMIVGVLYTSGYLAKLKAFKMRLFKK